MLVISILFSCFKYILKFVLNSVFNWYRLTLLSPPTFLLIKRVSIVLLLFEVQYNWYDIAKNVQVHGCGRKRRMRRRDTSEYLRTSIGAVDRPLFLRAGIAVARSVVSRDIPVCILRSDQTSPGAPKPRRRGVPASCIRAGHEERSERMPAGERAIVPSARSSSKSSINLRPRSPRDPAAAVRAARSVIDLRIPP